METLETSEETVVRILRRGRVHCYTDRQRDGQTDRGRQTDRQAGRQADRQREWENKRDRDPCEGEERTPGRTVYLKVPVQKPISSPPGRQKP